ncbi:hypothetical protein RUM43_008730, partial [Polyplax serrata]
MELCHGRLLYNYEIIHFVVIWHYSKPNPRKKYRRVFFAAEKVAIDQQHYLAISCV